MSGNWGMGGVSSQGEIQEFEKGGLGWGGGRSLCYSPNRQGVWGPPWPPEALGLKMLPGALSTDFLLILLQFYVQFQGQLPESLGQEIEKKCGL